MQPDKIIHAPTATVPIAQPTVEGLLVDGSLNLVAAIVILILGWVLANWAARWTRSALDHVRHFDETLKPLFSSLARYAILLAALIAVLQRFGVETTSLIALLGAAGLAVGLALQGTLSNVAAGVMLLLLRPFRVGDGITAAGQSGTVREIGLFTTILISADQAYVSIPNAAIFGGVIVNNSREPLTRINFTVSIDFANDVGAAQKIILDTLKSDRRILSVPPPGTGIVALKEYSVDLLVRGWVRNADSEATLFDLQRAIRDRFQNAGVVIPAKRQVSAERMEPEPAAQKAG
jgi:small conductance mechanosensitive channel